MALPAALTRLLISAIFLLATACATMPSTATDERELPPILAQDEIFRPYVKLGAVEVTRERMGHVEDLTNEADEWANEALAAEAAKLGADAVVLPEMRAEKNSYLFFPVTTIKVKGVAIRFH